LLEDIVYFALYSDIKSFGYQIYALCAAYDELRKQRKTVLSSIRSTALVSLILEKAASDMNSAIPPTDILKVINSWPEGHISIIETLKSLLFVEQGNDRTLQRLSSFSHPDVIRGRRYSDSSQAREANTFAAES